MLIELTRDILEANALAEDKERCKEHFYISDAGKCRRQMYYSLEFKHPLESNSAEAVFRMKCGKEIEEATIDEWKKGGILVDEQVRIEEKLANNHEIHGYVDAIVKVDGEDIPVEIKSFYGYYQAKELREGRPNENYLYQLALYLYFLKKPRGVLFYVDRSDMSMFEFDVRVDEFGHVSYKSTNEEEWKITKEYITVHDLLKDMRFVSNELMCGGDAVPEPDYNYKYDLGRFAEEVKCMSKTNLDKEIKKFRPIDQVKVKDDEGNNRLRYVYNGDMYIKKEDAIKVFNIDVKNGILPQIDSVCGNYQCKYCDYKTHCLESQGVELGYTPEEFSDRLGILLSAKGEK